MSTEIKGQFVKVIVGNELYLYFGGSLLYKRWINRGKGQVFSKNQHPHPNNAVVGACGTLK
jgi:hypothetical protein